MHMNMMSINNNNWNKIYKNKLKDIYLFIKGPKIKNPKIQSAPKSILFVCKGNICRSPFAEQVARKIAFEQSIINIKFYSAGLKVYESLTSPVEVIIVAEKFGVKLNEHKSRGITRKLATSFDMIIAMEAWHIQQLRKYFPDLKDKVYLLSLFNIRHYRKYWSYKNNNILDPYGKPVEYYQECFKRIEECIVGLLSNI